MDDPVIWCNNTYNPTSEQYMAALGSFGSTIIIIGGLVTVGLFVLFFEQVVYTNQTAHSACKRHIYWIASVFPMMTLMSLIALLTPRAHDVCLSVKMIYMSIGISHFTDLTMVMFGGEEQLLERGQGDTFNLRLSPLCCCCKCLPRPPLTKYSLRLVVLLTDQLPFVQATYYVLMLILLSEDHITLGDVNPGGAFLWLNIVKLASVLFGVYGFMILSNFSRGYLDDFQYGKKSRSINLLVLVTNMQLLAFNIMGNYNAFPCIAPYVSPAVYKQTVDNSLYLIEMMILGPYTYWQYHDLRFASPMPHLPLHNSRSRSSSSSFTHSSRASSSTSCEDEDRKDSLSSAGAADNSNGTTDDIITKDASNGVNNGGGEGNGGGGGDNNSNSEKTMKKNEGLEMVDCEKGDSIIAYEGTNILLTVLNTHSGSNNSLYKVTSNENGLSPSSDIVKDNKILVTSILGNDLTTSQVVSRNNSFSNTLTNTRSQSFASTNSNEERSTSRKKAVSNTTDSAFTSKDRKKEINTSKRKRAGHEKTSTAINLGESAEKASASKRSKSRNRNQNKDASSRKKGEMASRNSAKPSMKPQTTFQHFNEVSESTNNTDKDTMSSYLVNTGFTTTDVTSEDTFNSTTSKTISSLTLSPGMLNRAMSLSYPNMKIVNEYERLY